VVSPGVLQDAVDSDIPEVFRGAEYFEQVSRIDIPAEFFVQLQDKEGLILMIDCAERIIPDVIVALDLEGVRLRILTDDKKQAALRNGGRLWSESRSLAAIREYRQFLSLMLWCPGISLIPSLDIDEVWHGHILSTKQYEDDCQQVFGGFRHHFPISKDSGEDVENRVTRDETMSKFVEYFGGIPLSYEEDYFGSEGGCYGNDKTQSPESANSGPCVGG
jgi:hypothetical protein